MSAKKRTPAKAAGGAPPTRVEVFVTAPSVSPSDRLLLMAPQDMTASELLPENLVLAIRVADGLPCWCGPVWPQRGQDAAVLCLPPGCSQIAPPGTKLRLVLPGSDEAQCIRPAATCYVGFAAAGAALGRPGAPGELDTRLLSTLHRRLLGCVIPAAGLVWSFNGELYHVAPGEAVEEGAEYVYMTEGTVLRPRLESESVAVDGASPLGGLDSQIAELLQIMSEALCHPEHFAAYGLTPTRGALVTGARGTGKSTFAAHVARAVPGAAVLRVDGARLAAAGDCAAASAAVGRVVARAASVVAAGGACIVVVDDVDLLCTTGLRSNSCGDDDGDAEAEREASVGGGPVPSLGTVALVQAVAAFFDEDLGAWNAANTLACGSNISFDINRGRATARGVFVIGTARGHAGVDPGLRRPGRFEVDVALEAPNAQQRADIFRVCLRRCCSEWPSGAASAAVTDAELADLASRSSGYVGADLSAVCAAAAMAAVRRRLHEPAEAPLAVVVTAADLAEGLRAVQPTALREIQIDVPDVRWDDIGGQEDTKARLREAVEWPLTRPEVFERMGIRPPRGLLLYGPPGCSKTMMAKAMATEGRLNFCAVKGPELFSKYVGDSEKAVAEVFRKARAAAPCVIFFDEMDALAAARAGNSDDGGSSVGSRVVSQLLQELDGINVLQQVVVVAATNRPDLIDPALLRPGRIDRMLYVGLPDQSARAHIAGLQLRRVAHAADVTPAAAAAMSEGYSGAEIVGAFRDAAVRAVSEYSAAVAAAAAATTDASGGAPPPPLPAASSVRLELRHLAAALAGMPRQVTPQMLEFYAEYRAGRRS